MVSKIVISLLVLVVCFFAFQLVEQNVAPQHATGLVIEGVNQPDLMADNQAQMRIEQNSQNLLYPTVVLSCFVLIALIWKKEIKDVFVSFVTEEVVEN
jgi:hypothetical protein